jgi:hypothetical protein
MDATGYATKLCHNGRVREPGEPDDLDLELRRAQKKATEAEEALVAAIRKALAAGRKPARIARHIEWTAAYIAKIRDGKARKLASSVRTR